MPPQECVGIDRVADALREFYVRSHRVIDREMAVQGASFARSRMLVRIAARDTTRSSDLALEFGYAPRTVTETIDALERDGLVRRARDTADRRAKHVTATPAGVIVARNSEASHRRLLDRVYGGLSDDERGDFTRILAKLIDRLVDIEAQPHNHGRDGMNDGSRLDGGPELAR